MANLFNTRIRLRYDTYTNWTSKNPILLAGEVAIAVPGTGLGSVAEASTCLMKVGNGTSNFNALAWLSAPAADVHAWAKAKDVILDAANEKLQFKNGETVIAEVDLSHFASDAEVAALAGRVTVIENELNTATTGLKARVTALEGEMDTAQSDISTITGRLDTLEGENGVNGLSERVTTLEGEVDDLQAKDEEHSGAIQANAAAIAQEKVDREKAISDEQAARNEAITNAINGEVTNRNTAIEEAIADEVTARNTAISEAVATETNRATGVEADLGNRLTTAEGKLTVLTGDGEGSVAKALADAKAYTNEVKADLLGEGDLVETYDTLKEIGDWINTSGVDTTDLTNAIAAETEARTAADAQHTTDISNLRTDLATLTNSVGTVPANKTVMGLIGTVTEGKTLMDLISANTTAITEGDQATLEAAEAAAKKYTDDKIVEVNGANSALTGRVSTLETILDGIGGEGDTNTTVIAAIEAAEGRAKAHAEGKASAAQAAAEATAAADATAKANQAKEDAIADANGKFETVNSKITALENFDKTAITGVIDEETDTLTMSLDNVALNLIFVCGDASTGTATN